ncbi:hypothetical protein GGS21DRAFT_494291 [Xylaria nigripes]|nr:hypothetical protein GGS21DRAFT_494291 [Xylaria nigripes]
MPSAQPGLSAETRRGTGSVIPALSLSIHPLSDVVGAGWSTTTQLFARVRSAISLRGPGDMPKPASSGAPQPMNTLSTGNSTSPRIPLGLPSSLRTSSPKHLTKRQTFENNLSSPPTKRQKLSDSDSSPLHSHTILVQDTTPPALNRQEGNVPVTNSQSSSAPNGVQEYSLVDRWTKSKRSRARRSGSSFSDRDEDIEFVEPWLSAPSRTDDDVSEDEVNFIGPRTTLASPSPPKGKQPEERLITESSNNFKARSSIRLNPSQTFRDVVDGVYGKARREDIDLSPDELAPSADEVRPPRPVKRRRQFSPSLSRKGNIPLAKINGSSTTLSPVAMVADGQRIDEGSTDSAVAIISGGLHIRRAICGKTRYETDQKNAPDCCLLSVREAGHTLLPVDKDNNPLKSLQALTISIKKVKSILYDRDDPVCRIVCINFGTTEVSIGAGPKLMVEFASTDHLDNFIHWVELYRKEDSSIILKLCTRAKLEKDFEQFQLRTDRFTAATGVEERVGEDIKLIQHNQDRRVTSLQTGSFPVTESRARTKVREAMTCPPMPNLSDNGDATNQPRDGQQTVPQGQARTTRSTFRLIDSPEPREPEPEGWTSLNPGWARQWRNSLVYPATGKSRAIVDKEDIQRLDEGQFLNDNLIIFYLRYLQQKLENDKPDLAKRVYFQNTFFFDKLKPTKTGQGINYDSVKAWTSKVDLFSKDFIIVPINEYAHWYVAIIHNAPKLIPSPDAHEKIDGSESDMIANSEEIVVETSRPLQKDDTLHDIIDGDHNTLPVQENVIEGLRRMSIDSFDLPQNEIKQAIDNNAGEGVDLTTGENTHEVYLIKDSDKPEVEVEDLCVTGSQSHRKSTKRQNAYPRKYDSTQPRIITLDSLGAPHSPTCNYLRQYLASELRDKRGIEIDTSSAKGSTAKDVPEQTNHCDCGLFLLGYIQQFLVDPDAFISSILQRDGQIPWRLNPPELRSNIRNLIFDLQKQQQETEDAVSEQKKKARTSKLGVKLGGSSRAAAPTSDFSHVLSKIDLASQDCPGGKQGDNKSLPGSPTIRQASCISSGIDAGTVEFQRRPDPKSELQSSTLGVQNDDLTAERQLEKGDSSKAEEARIKSKMDPIVVASSYKPKFLYHETNNRIVGSLPVSPVRGRTINRLSPLSDMEGSVSIQNTFLSPLVSATPSTKSPGGATPHDPVILDEPDKNSQDVVPHDDPPLKRGLPFIVEISTKRSRRGSQDRDDTAQSVKATAERSPFFDQQDGERVITAKLRENTKKDVIDLSDD